ncbi:hypothetical protein C2G38_405377 [Gigaspora rosea]|uniref:Uncharacterized protein n=1 Tax=Gigaspora rosea TaxID=44941 RepID=A0A397UG35_9GLOM|nr:hypothetical protein C2G38_405377 [Gigaspora rosea]
MKKLNLRLKKMILSRVFVYSFLFLVIFVFIPSIESACSCCGKGGHNIRTCSVKDKCPLHANKIIWKEGKDGLAVSQNGYKGKISAYDCYFEIKTKAKKIKQGDTLKSSCNCAIKGDEQCHGIAKSLGGPGNCVNCMSCSKKMNIQMKSIESRVKSEGGHYIVTCNNKTNTETITQIFKPYAGDPTTTIIIRSPTIHSEF